jgi:hypothetical protein
MHVVVVSAEALSVLVFEEEEPLTQVGFDVINVACGYPPTLNRTLSALRFLGEPVPSDRLPSW